MELNKKLLLIAKRYDVFINTTSYPQTMCDLFKKVMIKAYEYHKYDVSFEEFIRNFTENPVEYAYQMSEKMEQKQIYLDLLTNCFKDGSSKHYGIKYKKYWFFVSHTNNEYSLKIPSNELNTYGEKYGDSFIVSYATCNPNILKKDCVRIHSRILDEYIDKFLK